VPSLYVNINININYLRFGNFIGEAVESDEEGSQYDDAGASAYVDMDEEDGEPGDGNNQQLMELDGIRCLCFVLRWVLTSVQKTKDLPTLLYFTKVSTFNFCQRLDKVVNLY
jgi:hypothetical protein